MTIKTLNSENPVIFKYILEIDGRTETKRGFAFGEYEESESGYNAKDIAVQIVEQYEASNKDYTIKLIACSDFFLTDFYWTITNGEIVSYGEE